MRRRGVADPCVLLLVADDLRDIGTRLLRAFEGAQHRCAGRASPNDTHAYHRAEIPAVGKNFTFVRWYLPRGERATLCSIRCKGQSGLEFYNNSLSSQHYNIPTTIKNFGAARRTDARYSFSGLRRPRATGCPVLYERGIPGTCRVGESCPASSRPPPSVSRCAPRPRSFPCGLCPRSSFQDPAHAGKGPVLLVGWLVG